MTLGGDTRPPIADNGEPGAYRQLQTGSPNSWLRPKVLWRSRNDILARIHDPVDAIREAWLALQAVPSGPERAAALRIKGHEGRTEPSFMLLGDTGEGDGSQMAVVPGLRAMSAGADFSIICSDVIYPAGITPRSSTRRTRSSRVPFMRFRATTTGTTDSWDS